MARIRTIKPELWLNEDLAAITEAANLLAIGLINYADDEGYFYARPELIKAALFPIRELSVSIHGGLTELSNIGFVELRKSADGKVFGKIVNFAKHQVINRPTPSQISLKWDDFEPIHGGLTEDSRSDHGGLTEDSLLEGKGREGKGKGVIRDREETTRAPAHENEAPPDGQVSDAEWKRKAREFERKRKAAGGEPDSLKPVSAVGI